MATADIVGHPTERRIMVERFVDGAKDTLAEVMTRFRDFFVEHMRQDTVPFRHRDDFVAPLVTVMGHSYGLRFVKGSAETEGETASLAIEVSANVYDDEFDLDRFKSKMREAHQTALLKRTIENFMAPEEAIYLRDEGPEALTSPFFYDLDRDLALQEKKKKSASKITGRLTDTILTMKYWIKPQKLEQLSRDQQMFKSALYLYCLRTFVLAYHQSLAS